MPPNPRVPDTRVIVDRATHTILLTRAFTAPREEVFEAWTRPEHVACWWDATGVRLAVRDRLASGRGLSICSSGLARCSAVQRRLSRDNVPPELLVFEAMGAIGRVLLKDTGGATLLTVSITCVSTAHLDQFLQMGVDAGTSQTLDNLVVYVGSLKRRSSSARGYMMNG